MASTKRKATEAPAEEAKGNAVFVVLYHHHTDDYKRADSCSRIVDVYDTEAEALRRCIVENAAENVYYDTVTSEVLQEILNTAFPNRQQENPVEEGDGPLSNFSRQEIKDTISTLTLEKLKAIATELTDSMEQIEPEYTMRPSMSTYTVHEKKILSSSND